MDGNLGEPHREIDGLFRSETWWNDYYRAIEEHGYRLRPRYNPDWRPSWKTSGKALFDTKDCQATLVRIFCFILPVLTTCVSYQLQ